MNPYDKAHELAKALANDPVIKEYQDIKEEINKDKELYDKIEEFKKNRTELQIKSIQDGKIDEKLEETVKQEYQELLSNELAIQYFEKEVKINVLIADIQKIIYEDIKDIL